MRHLSRLALPFLVLAGLGGVLAYRRGGLSDALREVARESRRTQAMDARYRVFCRHAEARKRITDEVIAGRLTLREAASRFRRLNVLTDGAGAEELGPCCLPRREEEVYRQLLAWVRDQLPGDPRQATQVLERLEGERRQAVAAAQANGR